MRSTQHKRHLVLGIAVISALIIALVAMLSPKLKPCQPNFTSLNQGKSIEVSLGTQPAAYGIKATLIGCKEELNTITPSEHSRLSFLIKDILRREAWQIWPKSYEESFRAEVAERMNSLLGQTKISDVFLYGFSASE